MGIGLIPYVGLYLVLFIEFSIFPVLLIERVISYSLNIPYLKRAKRRIQTYQGNVIAVTGSFGKTPTNGN